MDNHTQVINRIATEIDCNKYLELGVQSGRNYFAINAKHKTGVDPDDKSKSTHKMTSDEFFARNTEKFDLIFIDADHTKESVKKDFINAMSVLNDGGYIVMHDTNPEREEWTSIPRVTKQWTGDVYKFICNLQADFVTLPFDYGVTVVRKSEYVIFDLPCNWAGFDTDRNKILNIVNEDEFEKWIKRL